MSGSRTRARSGVVVTPRSYAVAAIRAAGRSIRRMPETLTGHAGEIAVAVARAHGVDAMFTLSGAHVFPLYDGAVKADPPMPLIDVRHEATAVFAAEGLARLTRRPGLAVLTAGPGVTNGVSAVTTAYFTATPLRAAGGLLQRHPTAGRRRPRAGGEVGAGQPSGARSSAPARAGDQTCRHDRRRR